MGNFIGVFISLVTSRGKGIPIFLFLFPHIKFVGDTFMIAPFIVFVEIITSPSIQKTIVQLSSKLITKFKDCKIVNAGDFRLNIVRPIPQQSSKKIMGKNRTIYSISFLNYKIALKLTGSDAISLNAFVIIDDGSLPLTDKWLDDFLKSKKDGVFGKPPILCFSLANTKNSSLNCIPLKKIDLDSFMTILDQIHHTVHH